MSVAPPRFVWHVLEGHFGLVLANAAHVKNVPGRKTDVNDAMWLADLLAHGQIRASFVPPAAVQDLRSLTRTRKQFVRERSSYALRIDKLLEDANLKLGVVLSDILGKSGRAVLQALIDGERDPQRLATHVNVRVKASRAEVKSSYLQAQFHRLRARRGAKKAIIGVAASMLTAAWHMLRDGTEWHDLGATHFDRADAAKTANRLIRRLLQIGYVVQATPA
jgi:hypothetical protein